MRFPWLGINYANGLNGYIPTNGYPAAQVGADLYFIRTYLGNRIRVALPDWNFPTEQIDQLKRVILQAQAVGIQVIWGITSTNTLLTTTNWQAYSTAVLSQAKWAQSVGLRGFFVGNELDAKHDASLTDVQQRANLRNLAASVKAAGYKGEVTLSVAQDKITPWYAEGIGALDSLGLDLYVQHEASFVNLLKAHVNNLGTRAYLAEWNIYNYWEMATEYHNEERLATLLTNRINHIDASGIGRAYYFCYEHSFYSNLAASDDVWALRLANGDFRRMVQPLTSPRRWFA